MKSLLTIFTPPICRSPDDNHFGLLEAEHSAPPLAGRSILLIEDELVVAMDVQYALEDFGARVVGPFDRFPKATEAVNAPELNVDAAVLDLDLHGEDAFSIAQTLQSRGVPFVLHTGHGDEAELALSFPNAPLHRKPSVADELMQSLIRLLR